MPDLLIRDFSADDLNLLDGQAKRLGLSRAEYLRRQLHQTAQRIPETNVTVADLAQLANVLSDLGDESVMNGAWL
jgi:hypothetical protein